MAQLKEGALILVLSAIVLTNLYDLFLDYSHNASAWHLFEESLVVVVSATAIFWLMFSLLKNVSHPYSQAIMLDTGVT